AQKDLIGGDEGRRRPGYAISVEPGITWSKGRYFASLTVPIAVERNRQPDYGSLDGMTYTGDSAFADYTINASFAFRF
ncbi:MAG TPA: transporter, partial [Verrucomicrobiae bacterium]|nr:transporter [Verrucomicrobiae bacterium]